MPLLLLMLALAGAPALVLERAGAPTRETALAVVLIVLHVLAR